MSAPDEPVGTGPRGIPSVGGPFVGPRPFRRGNSGHFFGRGREARDVRSLWLAERVLVLHGPSAVGKTSLLNAGVLPLLAKESDIDVLPAGRLVLQTARPLAEALPHNGFSFTLISSWNQAGRAVWPGLSIADFLRDQQSAVNEFGEPRGILAAVDQFEELFTSFPARQAEREDFIAELGEVLREVPTLRLLLLVRDDHLAALKSLERKIPYPVTYVRLDPLGLAAAREAVSKPFERFGRPLTEGVAEQLIEILRTTTYTDLVGETVTLRRDWVEPLLLQIVCSQLWASLPAELEAVGSVELERFGDVDRAVVQFYERAVREVQEETGESEETLRTWIESVFVTESGTRGNAYRGFSMTCDMPNKVVDALAERHILAAEWRAQGTWYELSQDRLTGAVVEANARWHEQSGRPLPRQVSAVATPASFRAAAEEAFGLGNYQSARRFAQVAESRYRESGDSRRLAQTLVLEGDICQAEGDFEAARENLNEALTSFAVLGDSNARARTLSALADVCIAAGDYAAAEEFELQALQQQPASVDALIGLGYAQWYLGSPADAEVTFAQALSWAPDHPRALAGRGQVRAEMQQYAAARDDLTMALERGATFSDETDARSALAVTLAALGDTAEAERELAIARSQDPRRARTHLRAAQVAIRLGRIADARDALDVALREDSGLPPAERERARTLRATLS